MWDIVGLDRPCVDIVVNVNRFPEANGREKVQTLLFQGGGKAATGLCAASWLGAKCALMGTVGDDDWADFCAGETQKFGVDVSRLRKRTGHCTSISVVISDRESQGRSILSCKSQGPTLAFREMDQAALRDTKYLYLPWLDGEFVRAAKTVREAGGRVMLDADCNTQFLMENLSNLDILIGSEKLYGSLFGGAGTMAKNLGALSQKGPEMVLFTFGPDGAAGYSRQDGFFVQPAFRLPVTDTLGAGDVFHGAFLAGLIAGKNVPEAAKLACAVAALKCTRPGGRTGIPTREQAEELMKTGAFHAGE